MIPSGDANKTITGLWDANHNNQETNAREWVWVGKNNLKANRQLLSFEDDGRKLGEFDDST